MVDEARCPHCEGSDLVEADETGVWRCRACGRSSLSTSRGPGTVPPRVRTDAGVGRRVPGEVPAWPSALAGLVLTAAFYLLLGRLPGGRIPELFLDRGFVPYVVTAMASWALLLLAHRTTRLRAEARLLDHDWLAADHSGRIAPSGVPAVLDGLARGPAPLPTSFLARRLARALRHFESRRRVVEVVEYLSAESSADEGRVDASYALVRVFVWAVPTLGFIGTVLGIGAAVGGFSETLEAASSLDGMKESIGAVTGGLGVAFDTTLLALVMSIAIMFPASAVQRLEENLLADVDDYCADVLLPRLEDAASGGLDDATLAGLSRRLAEELAAPRAGSESP